jgi:cysteinyl-tRNA synthetase
MKVYNTLAGKKEEFIPIEEGKIKMYVCGPTVYNLIHIGNARPMIVFDTVRRYFEYKGYEVNYVSNFTDIDDKIIKKAAEECMTSEEIAKKYIEECKKDMEALNVRPATKHPLATEEIDSIIDMIKNLIGKNMAYEKNGTVYFRTRKFSEYGKLSKKNLDDLQAGNRTLLVTGKDEKDDTLDFVLWKPMKPKEPYWVSPWSNGRPGWHIECSVMAKRYLGDYIDIHAGGEDLVFPHHENEIAQSEAANGVEFAKYWLHNAFLNINNKKMSKSANNFFTVRDIAEKYDLQVLRFFMLSAHYRSQLNFSEELMEAAKNSLERILTAVDKLNDLEKILEKSSEDIELDKLADNAEKFEFKVNTDKLSNEENINVELVKTLVQKYEASMEDDFNTADAISFIFEIVKLSNSTTNTDSTALYVRYLKDTIENLCYLLGIKTEKKEEILEAEILELIQKRNDARKAKDFALADKIRNELLDKGIVIEDTREGVKWRKI